jgi:hypothetical protein
MNLEELLGNIGVEKLAISASNDNSPPKKSSKPDSNEEHIRQSFIDALFSEIKDINSKIDDYKIMIAEKIEESKKSIEVGAKAAKNFSHAASTLKTKQLTKLKSLKKVLKIKINDLEMFKNEHQLERSASYPESPIFIGGIIAVLLLIETVLNGVVLAKNLEGGYLGGLGNALIIAFINVIPAFMVGKYIFIQNWHISKFRRIACRSISFIWFICAIVWNLFVAHTRDHMDLEKPLGNNLEQFLSNPPISMIEINSLDSWTLLFVGFIFAIIALIDGIKSDDLYFGYGDVDRQVKETEEKIYDVVKGLTNSLDELKDKYDKDLSTEEQTVKTAKNTIESYHAGRDMLIRTFEDDVESVKGQAKIQIKKYREVNAKKREDEPPKYFEKEPAALVFKKRDFKKINIDDLDLDPQNTFIEAKLAIAKEYNQLNSEISEKHNENK